MHNKLSVLMISKNNQDTIARALKSVIGISSQVILIDSKSTDETVNIAKKHKALILSKEFDDIGKQRLYGFKHVISKWVLILDSDEVVSQKLSREITQVLAQAGRDTTAFNIPYLNHYLGKSLKYGGENYSMIRLFKVKALTIAPSVIHNNFIQKYGKTQRLSAYIYHYSYRSLPQMYKKFTNYAIRDYEMKRAKGERSSLKKIFMYPAHMFYARFIKDKGYKDGLFRIPLDLGFAYMEFLTYLLLAIKPK